MKIIFKKEKKKKDYSDSCEFCKHFKKFSEEDPEFASFLRSETNNGSCKLTGLGCINDEWCYHFKFNYVIIYELRREINKLKNEIKEMKIIKRLKRNE